MAEEEGQIRPPGWTEQTCRRGGKGLFQRPEDQGQKEETQSCAQSGQQRFMAGSFAREARCCEVMVGAGFDTWFSGLPRIEPNYRADFEPGATMDPGGIFAKEPFVPAGEGRTVSSGAFNLELGATWAGAGTSPPPHLPLGVNHIAHDHDEGKRGRRNP